jgi:hypothetical protein
MTLILYLLTSQTNTLCSSQTMKLLTQRPSIISLKTKLFKVECLTTILQTNIFISLFAKAISNIINNNKLQFCRSFGAVSVCFGLKMGI